MSPSIILLPSGYQSAVTGEGERGAGYPNPNPSVRRQEFSVIAKYLPPPPPDRSFSFHRSYSAVRDDLDADGVS